jgi:hypothetical protein
MARFALDSRGCLCHRIEGLEEKRQKRSPKNQHQPPLANGV